VIREADKEGAVTVCGGGSRARTVYVSKLNRVQLQVVADLHHAANQYVFIFLYEGRSLRSVRLCNGSDLASDSVDLSFDKMSEDPNTSSTVLGRILRV